MRTRKAAAIPASLPLFERKTRSSIAMLLVRRLEEDGRWVRAPRTFHEDELPNREAVRAQFGGGKYEVIGRDAQRIVARTTFLLEGVPLPLAPPADPPVAAVRPTGDRAFATDDGERQGLVYRMFDDGLTCIEVTKRTGIEDDTVREIYLRWLTPDGLARPTTVEEIGCYQRLRMEQRRSQLRSEWEQAAP